MRSPPATILALFAGLALPAGAAGAIHPASVLDGPANNIVEVDGTAMASDGTGGVVYRKSVEGIDHVFAVQVQDGHWGAPIEVDTADSYGASEPAIAAGDGGRLLVVWVQPRNTSPENVPEYELMGAALQPGASSFGQAITIDGNVGEPYTGEAELVDPRLAMAPDGVAYVVYRVLTFACNRLRDPIVASQWAQCSAGGTQMEIRAARYSYLFWTSLGSINRAPQITLRAPTSANLPAIGIEDLPGNNGVVAWQEPDSGGVARIWVRRLFGTTRGNVLQASPSMLGGHTVTSDADSPTLSVSPYGGARVAYLIHGAPGSAVAGTGLYTNNLPSSIDFHGAQFGEATRVADAGQGALGAPDASIDLAGDFQLAWLQGANVQLLSGGESSLGSTQTLGAGGGQPFATVDPAGGGTTAWSDPNGAQTVDVREQFAQGATQSAKLAGDVAGGVSGLSLAGDGHGDALLAWSQGPTGRSEVIGAFVQAPPGPFDLVVPKGWVHPAQATIGWEEPFAAADGLSYSVYVDGRRRLSGLTGLGATLPLAGLGDGTHSVQVIATDPNGQQTKSTVGELRIDADPPVVHAQLIDHGRGVLVSVSDMASGVDAAATRIAFGDGAHAHHGVRDKHVYRTAGTYTIVADVRDRAGNRASVTIHVRVR
jgi:hypothetical protein